MHTYGALYNGDIIEIKATSSYEAQQLALVEFQKNAGRRKVKGYQITVMLTCLDNSKGDIIHIADF